MQYIIDVKLQVEDGQSNEGNAVDLELTFDLLFKVIGHRKLVKLFFFFLKRGGRFCRPMHQKKWSRKDEFLLGTKSMGPQNATLNAQTTFWGKKS